ncbi:MAG: hypothetical protein IJW08_00330 [Lentisphaeria bacterium]|nr:hypothetical protein [Lentisphaeria bacterium]
METNIIEILLENWPEDWDIENFEALGSFSSEFLGSLSDWVLDSNAVKMLVYENVFADGLEALEDSVERVASSFDHPTPEVFHSERSYGEHWAENPLDPTDDRIGADVGIVQAINEKYGHSCAYDVITAHEMTHAKLASSGISQHLAPYAEEVICDIYSGAYSGHNGLPTDIFTGEIGGSPADNAHPAGAERVDFYLRAHDLASRYPVYHPFYQNGINNLVNEALQKYSC